MDGFPEELKGVVHEHWGTFPPQHPLIPDLFAIVFFFLWCISFFGNGCVVYIFLASPKLRTPVRTSQCREIHKSTNSLLYYFVDKLVHCQSCIF